MFVALEITNLGSKLTLLMALWRPYFTYFKVFYI